MSKGSASAGFRAVHAKSIKGLAWASFVIAVADGALLPSTFVGDFTRQVFSWLPWGPVIPIIVLIIGFVAAFLDCYLDLEPNQVAVYAALMLPTVASTLSGGLADWVRDISRTALNAIDQWLFQAVPNGVGSQFLAVAIAFAVLMMASRVVNKSRRG